MATNKLSPFLALISIPNCSFLEFFHMYKYLTYRKFVLYIFLPVIMQIDTSSLLNQESETDCELN
jgi:hypothetical protein